MNEPVSAAKRRRGGIEAAPALPEAAHFGMAKLREGKGGEQGGGGKALHDLSLADQEALALRMLARRGAYKS
jgi:hypothetical protein